LKTLLIASTITVLTLSSIVFAPQAQASNIAQNLCDYVAADDKKRMRSYLKSNKLKLRAIFDGVQCNGKNLLVFASDNNAVKTGSLMISKLPKKVISNNLTSLESGNKTLVDVANNRVSS
jgi:hypothetical protein